MRIVRINEAEAIISPLWDGNLAEIDRYSVRFAKGTRGSAAGGFAAAQVAVDHAVPGRPSVHMRRSCRVRLDEYDVLRLFAAFPAWVRLTITARVDGKQRVILRNAPGADTTREYDGTVRGKMLTGFEFAFTLTESRPTIIVLRWVGLACRAAQERMETRPAPYTPDWPGMLEPEPDAVQPEIGVFFDARELNALRRGLRHGPLNKAYPKYRRGVRKWLEFEPEKEIGRLLARPDGRFCRTRDMSKTMTANVMASLAFVGLVDDDRECSVMAARMALAAAHCDYWYESDIGVFPGSTWHHRSFTEENYCRACALVLDWAGPHLTRTGKAVIRDAIIMKGLPRIESDFKTMEYIRTMNQGIVFSSGRILGLLALLPVYPRYGSQLAEAERDLFEMIDAYVQADGGTLEGMGYWQYTFNTCIPLLYALARHHGKPFRNYVPPSLVKTAGYPLAMLSTAGDGATALPINDCHSGTRPAPGLAAALALVSRSPEWRELHTAAMADRTARVDTFGLILGGLGAAAGRGTAGTAPEGAALNRPRLRVLPVTGQASSVRRARNIGLVHFHLCSGPTHAGHSHEDTGSFILEAAGDVLAMDRGVTSYNHPETGLMGWAGRHNLLYPETADGSWIHQLRGSDGGRLGPVAARGSVLLLATDNVKAWEPGLFRRNVRRVASPVPELYILDDDIRLGRPMAASFRLNSRRRMKRSDGEVWVTGGHAALRIVPLNWDPVEVTTDLEGIDDHLQPVRLLRMVSAKAATHRLLTAIEVCTAGKARWTFKTAQKRIIASRGTTTATVRPHAAGASSTFGRAGKTVWSADCRGADWTFRSPE